MHFDVGKLNKRIIFTTYGEQMNEIGQTVLGDLAHRTVWASVRKLRGYELSVAERLNPESVYHITTRYFEDIREDMKIIYNGKTLYITNIVDVDEGHFALEITATDKGDENG